jgi:DNA-binding NtrC family response regulator
MNMTMKTANILLVDDDPVSVQVVARTLTRAGFAPVSAANGEEAMKYLDTHHFDAVVSDVRMPRMSGIELLQNIRARFPSLPVFLMSGDIKDDVREAAFVWGAAALFEKPVNRGELVVSIRLAFDESSRPPAECEMIQSV